MLYVYGAVSPDTVAPSIAGIGRAAVRVLRLDRLAVAVSEVASTPERSAERFREHHLVTLALAAQGVAPFRFGTVVASEEELSERLSSGLEAAAASLGAVAGCVELSVRLRAPAPDAPAATSGPGTAYLLAKKRDVALEELARERAHRLRERLGQMVKDARGEVDAATPGTPARERGSAGTARWVRVALLVETGKLAELRSRLAELEPDALVSGPWAPSSFV